MSMIMLRRRGEAGGFVSIFSVLIIMSILTLVLVGFSAATREAEKRTLDTQLSTQAFYAAESGINAAKAKLLTEPTYSKAACTGGDSTYFKYTLDSSLGVGYTCVLINSNPESLSFTSVGVLGRKSPVVATLASSDDTVFDEFDVTWSSKSGGALPNTAAPRLETGGTWGDKTGMVRFDVVPEGTLDRAALASNAYTFFLYPSSSAGTSGIVDMSSGLENKGALTLVRCDDATGQCKLTVRLTSAISNRYTLRLQALYNEVKVDISKVTNTLNETVSLKDGQIVIDSTGKANDVFRRIQVRLPYQKKGTTGVFALLSADSICKRLAIGLPTTTDVTDNPACSIDPGPLVVPPGAGPPVIPPPRPIVSGPQRFPGDPNTLVTGKSYWGAAIDTNGPTARLETPTGKSLSIHRTFWQWVAGTNKSSSMYRTIVDDHANNRLPFVSIKPPDVPGSQWQAVASGAYDAAIDKMFRDLDSYGKPVWFVIAHEPEGGASSGTVDDPGGAPAWRAMQIKMRQRMTAVGTKNIAFMPILMSYTWGNSGRNPEDWWVPNIWDAYIVDHYRDNVSGDMFTSTNWPNFVRWVEAKGMPYGTGEWGNRGMDAQGAAEMQAFWDYAMNGGGRRHDIIAYTYFDSGANSPNGSWVMSGPVLEKFLNISKSDPRVQRINEL